MQFIDHAAHCGGMSISLMKAVDAGRATPVAVFRSSKLTRYFNPVPDANAAFDHGVTALSAFLNLNSPDVPDLLFFRHPEIYWPGLNDQPAQDPGNGQLSCGWQDPDLNF